MPASKPRKASRERATRTFADVQLIALKLPGVEVSQSYGTPALKVRGKLFVRFHDDGETLVVRTTPTDREYLLATWPHEFYLTEHYRNYPWVLVRLGTVSAGRLSDVIIDAWERVAPPPLRAQRRREP
jgi:hypothetical protein